ncbi:hypothetical protein EW146_g3021 [Bondarzewia mesenterica]|uniref:CUE domain-containing protein n=1 Tax=Bondarzewia mesenterica TaxID=1095465 RepID=A0A4V3XFK4_9AGAM|nr:hypothetical protein EW146_g3021 [Bondarzewia mesenterica]
MTSTTPTLPQTPPPPGYSLDPDNETTRTNPPTESTPAAVSSNEALVANPTSPPQIAPETQTSAEGDQRAPTPPPRPQEDEFANPQIASLHAIFPDFDAALLQSVLESVGADQDRAVDVLLGMSDPDYVPAAQEQAAPRSQTELDEEFARQLMLEEQQQQGYSQWQLSDPSQGQSFPYEARTGARLPPGQVSPGRDTLTEVQEQFNKFAESGKRTFSSIVSKVKAKVQEFDQQRNGQGPAGTQPTWGSSSTAGQTGLDRHAQQAYYAPSGDYEEPYPIQPLQGYDISTPSIITLSNQSTAPVRDPAQTTSSFIPASTDTPPPPATNSGRPAPNIDPGKVGLLPKRPVSLIRPSDPQALAQNKAHEEDQPEELEYMENPFEENVRE